MYADVSHVQRHNRTGQLPANGDRAQLARLAQLCQIASGIKAQCLKESLVDSQVSQTANK